MNSFSELWRAVWRSETPDPEGAAGELVNRLAEALDVEVIEFAEFRNEAAVFLLNLSRLGFKGFDLNVVMVARHCSNDDEALRQAEILREVKHLLNSSEFSLVISNADSTEVANPHLVLAGETVFLGNQELHRLLESKAAAMVLFEIIRRQVQLTHLCPFNTSHEARSDTFRGRRRERELLKREMRSSFLVCGARRIGKTSLLKIAFTDLRNSPLFRTPDPHQQRVFFFNCINWRGYDDCAARLAHRIDQRRETRMDLNPRNLAYMLERRSFGGNRPLILFFDEMDATVEHDSGVGWPFFRLLHEAVGENWVRVCFAGYRSMNKLNANGGRTASGLTIPNHGSPFYGALECLELQALTREEAGSLIIDPFQAVGIPIRESSEVFSLVWEASAGHPFMVQFFGEQLFRQAEQMTFPEVTPDMVRKVANGPALSDFLVTHFLENTTVDLRPADEERLCAFLLAHSARETQWVKESFVRPCCEIRPDLLLDQVNTALHNLTLARILERIDKHYNFAIPALRERLREEFPTIESLYRR